MELIENTGILRKGKSFSHTKKQLLRIDIKPTSRSNYKNVVDALDEAVINDVKKYAILEPSPEELIFLKTGSGQ